MKRSASLLLAWTLATGSAAIPAFGQEPLTRYEVAAIKPGRPGEGGGVQLAPDGRFTATNVTLASLIPLAFGLNAYQVTGGPPWLSSQLFSIQAKAPGDSSVSRANHARMIQSLLIERFGLKTSRGTQSLPAYALVVDRKESLSKLKPGDPGRPAQELAPVASAGTGKSDVTDTSFQYSSYTIAQFITRLSFYLRSQARDTTPILDQTGLTGRYDFTLPTSQEMGGGPNAPSVFTTLREIGLRLQKGEYPLEMLTIEGATLPEYDN